MPLFPLIFLLIGTATVTAVAVSEKRRKWAEEEQQQREATKKNLTEVVGYGALAGLAFGLGALMMRRGDDPPRLGGA
jgi:hypothetical protein